MKPTAFIRTPIQLATGAFSGIADVVQAGTNCHGEPMFDLFHGGRRMVSSIPLSGLRRAKAAPRMPQTLLIWPLLKEYREGLRWRQTFRKTIVASMKARTPEAYCQHFWLLDNPGSRMLAFARGAVGLPFIEPILIDQPTDQVPPPEVASADPVATSGDASCSVKPASASRSTKSNAWATARALFE